MAGCGCGCENSSSNWLVYACSGAANTGYLADSVARRFSIQGLGKMTCLAAVASNLSGILESAIAVDNIIIDGCPVPAGSEFLMTMDCPTDIL